MKRVLLILDGASDAPLPALGGRTPLEAARTPHLDALAGQALRGRVRTAVPGLPVDSLVCLLGLLGYDPRRHHPGGRASFEALGRGIPLGPADLALRCNLVAVDPKGRMEDSTGGMPSDAEAGALLAGLRLPDPSWELHAGQSYRNLLVIRGAGALARDLDCAEPHMHRLERLESLLPRGRSPRGRPLAAALGRFVRESRHALAESGRAAWLWSPSTAPVLPPFPGGGTVVAALDFLRGLARAAGLEAADAPGATGDLRTDYAAKGQAALAALSAADFVLVHVNAPDEAAHRRDPAAKIRAIERADAHILGPLMQALAAEHRGGFCLAVCADHATGCLDGRHRPDPPPFLLHDERARKTSPPGPGRLSPRFTEAATADLKPVPAGRLLDLCFPERGRPLNGSRPGQACPF